MSSPRIVEEELLAQMLRLYCRRRHGGAALCPACTAVQEMLAQHLRACSRPGRKAACGICRQRCFTAAEWSVVGDLMRSAGGMFFLRHPLATMRHAAYLTAAARERDA